MIITDRIGTPLSPVTITYFIIIIIIIIIFSFPPVYVVIYVVHEAY